MPGNLAGYLQNQNGFFPLIILTSTRIIAITSRACTNPPMVVEVTRPSIHRIIKTRAIV